MHSKTLLISLICILVSLVLRKYIKLNVLYQENNSIKRDKRESNDQLSKHCNFLEDIQLIEEAATFEEHGFHLQKVIVLIRHGDRAPLRRVRDLDELYCNKSYLNNDNLEERKYLDLVDSFLEDKPNLVKWSNVSTDFIDLPNEFPDERCKLNKLTKFGVSQHIKLGYLISRAYASKLNLSSHNIDGFLKVVTTKYTRTFQSAFSFLYGFYIQLNASIFNVFPNFTYSLDPYFCGIDESNEFCSKECHNLHNLREKLHWSALLEPDEVNEVNSIVEEIKHIVAAHRDETVKFRTLVHIFDALNAYLCHHESLPCHENPSYGCVSSSRVQEVLAYICTLGRKLQNSHSHKHSSWLKIYGFLNGLLEELDRPNKFVLYSGHDITIESLKSVFSFRDCLIPSYASRIIFEIYTKFERKFVRILYNGNDLTHRLTIESNHINLIDAEHFKNYIHRNFESFTNTKDYKTACGFETFQHGQSLDQDRI